MGVILFIISFSLSVLFMPIGIAYSLIRLWIKANFITWIRRVDSYFKIIAVSIDQIGNVVMQELFNDVLIAKEGYKFGNEDETISSVLGKNKEKLTLRYLGHILSSLLNKLDQNHVENSKENV